MAHHEHNWLMLDNGDDVSPDLLCECGERIPGRPLAERQGPRCSYEVEHDDAHPWPGGGYLCGNTAARGTSSPRCSQHRDC